MFASQRAHASALSHTSKKNQQMRKENMRTLLLYMRESVGQRDRALKYLPVSRAQPHFSIGTSSLLSHSAALPS